MDLSKVGKRIGNLSDLPEELRSELPTTLKDELEIQIIECFIDLEGIANIDEILVFLYRKYGVIQKRAFLASKIYRMVKSRSLEKIKGKKGIYRLVQQNEANFFL